MPTPIIVPAAAVPAVADSAGMLPDRLRAAANVDLGVYESNVGFVFRVVCVVVRNGHEMKFDRVLT